MKYLLAILLACSSIANAQSQKDYEEIMGKFVNYYNNGDVDGICTLFPVDTGAYSCFWKWAAERREEGNSHLDEYGRITSYKYLGVDPSEDELAVFKMVIGGEIKAMSFTLDRNNIFGTCRFITSSESIDKMLAADKD